MSDASAQAQAKHDAASAMLAALERVDRWIGIDLTRNITKTEEVVLQSRRTVIREVIAQAKLAKII